MLCGFSIVVGGLLGLGLILSGLIVVTYCCSFAFCVCWFGCIGVDCCLCCCLVLNSVDVVYVCLLL